MELLWRLYAGLGLRINESKREVDLAWNRKLLGYSFWEARDGTTKRKSARGSFPLEPPVCHGYSSLFRNGGHVLATSICVPKPRAGGVLGLLRRCWTTPTTLVGHALARLAGCGAPQRVGGRATSAYLYLLPRGRLRGLGAIALGHVVVVEQSFLGDRRRWLLAHELSHARQHDWLGPFYLVAHATCQIISTLASAIRPLPRFTPQHAYNPLERSLLCVPFDVLVAALPPSGGQAQEVLEAFDLINDGTA